VQFYSGYVENNFILSADRSLLIGLFYINPIMKNKGFALIFFDVSDVNYAFLKKIITLTTKPPLTSLLMKIRNYYYPLKFNNYDN